PPSGRKHASYPAAPAAQRGLDRRRPVASACGFHPRREGTMGIFDGFSGSQIQLTPQLALAAGLIYVSAADGHLAEDERYDILKIVPDDNVLRLAQDYCRRTPFS